MITDITGKDLLELKAEWEEGQGHVYSFLETSKVEKIGCTKAGTC